MRSRSTPFKLNHPSCVRYILILSPLLHQCFCDFHGIFILTNSIYNTESLAINNELVCRSKQQAHHNYYLLTLTNCSETNFLVAFSFKELASLDLLRHCDVYWPWL